MVLSWAFINEAGWAALSLSLNIVVYKILHLGHPLSGVSMPFGLVVPLSKMVLEVWASNGISLWVSILIDLKCVCDHSVCFLRLEISLVSIMLEQTLCKLSQTIAIVSTCLWFVFSS